jgi:hypothetical protein
MKKAILTSFCIIVLFSLLAINTGIVQAPPKAGYTIDDFTAVTAPTMDGAWTTPTEWSDAAEARLEPGLNAMFKLKFTMDTVGFTWVNQYYLIEFFSDNTSDARDFWQLGYSASTTLFGTPIGGTTPQTDCMLVNYTGHSRTSTLTVYKGTGTGWSVFTGYTWPTDIEIVDSIGTSPYSATPHWIVEIKIEHMHFTISPEFWIRVAAYDASNPSAGIQSWPTGSQDVPNDYGLMNAQQTAFPEALSFGVMVLLTSIAVVVGARYFRKLPRIKVPA